MSELQYKQQADAYLQWVNANYRAQYNKLKSYCIDKHYKFDEDIFCNTYLKVYDKILKYGIRDNTAEGYDNYTFKAFRLNTLREPQYARNTHKADITDIADYYERYMNSQLTGEEKLLSDLKKDFSALYLIQKAEEYANEESFYLFKLKMLSNMTYREITEYTGLRGVRDKVIDVKNHLKSTVTKEEIDKAFDLFQRNYL